MQIFPSLIVNPSQDYNHLKDGRAAIEHNGYSGLRAPSGRVKGAGNIVVLFNDQSGNVQSITPFTVEFRLVSAGPTAAPFTNHAAEVLDFAAGEVKLAGTPLGIAAYANWHRIEFHH
jgi:hypothetical protein